MTRAVREILIADDHALLRAGLGIALLAAFPHASITQCGTWSSVHRSLDTLRFDLILLDIFMPRRRAWEQELWRVKLAAPEAAICILSASAEPDHIRAAAAAGARAYLTKTLDVAQILAVLRRVLAGETVFPDPEAPAAAPADGAPTTCLTARQQEVVKRLAVGASNRDIADAMGLTENTVKRHVHNICRRLGAANREQAVALARAARLLSHY
jgi:two-component system, NarL family, nitrate/nitrite response regulator NarL